MSDKVVSFGRDGGFVRRRVESNLRERNYEDALAVTDEKDRYLRARVYHRMGRNDLARRMLRGEKAYRARAVMSLSEGDYDAARRYALRALEDGHACGALMETAEMADIRRRKLLLKRKRTERYNARMIDAIRKDDGRRFAKESMKLMRFGDASLIALFSVRRAQETDACEGIPAERVVDPEMADGGIIRRMAEEMTDVRLIEAFLPQLAKKLRFLKKDEDYLALCRYLADHGLDAEASEALLGYITERPCDPRAVEMYAALCQRPGGDADRAGSMLKRLARLDPDAQTEKRPAALIKAALYSGEEAVWRDAIDRLAEAGEADEAMFSGERRAYCRYRMILSGRESGAHRPVESLAFTQFVLCAAEMAGEENLGTVAGMWRAARGEDEEMMRLRQTPAFAAALDDRVRGKVRPHKDIRPRLYGYAADVLSHFFPKETEEDKQ